MKKTKKTNNTNNTTTDVPVEQSSTNIMDRATDELKQKYGLGSFITPNDKDDINKRIVAKNVIVTKSISFNTMTGVCGIPKGRMYLLSGPAGIGKTTTSLACFMDSGYTLLYCDVEHRLDLGLLDCMNIDRHDKDKFILILPNTADEAFDGIDRYLKIGRPFFIIVDSITALKQKVETDKSNPKWLEGKRPGQDAKSISDFLKEITPALSKSQSILFMLSQYRTKDILRHAYKDSTGGLAPSYYVTYTLDIKKPFGEDSGEIYRGEQLIGQELIMNFKKTTTSLPPAPRRVSIRYGRGFYVEYELTKLGLQKLLIEKHGNWYKFKDINISGEINFVDQVEQDKKLCAELRSMINKYDDLSPLINELIELEIIQIFDKETKTPKQSTFKTFQTAFKSKKYFLYQYKTNKFENMVELVQGLDNKKILNELKAELSKEVTNADNLHDGQQK